MKIAKILNNNVVIAKDDNGKEVVVMKLGLGFSKKTGDIIPQAEDLKIFVLSDEVQQQYSKMLKDINPEAIELAEKVITYAVTEKKMKLTDMIHLTLADHIDGVFERIKKGISMKNPLTVELRRVYRQEFEVGIFAKHLLEEKTHQQFLTDEAAFIAMHFVNSKSDEDTDSVEAETVIGFIRDVTKIVEKYFDRKMDEESICYLRFVRHLKFFVHRIYEDLEYRDDAVLYDSLKTAYPEAADCVDKIVHAINLKYKKEISLEEKAYLIIYVEKLNRE